jgi:MFS family permease
MYQTENWKTVLKLRTGAIERPRVSSTVITLGLTSLFTDISSEMTSTVLPLYLMLTLQFSPLQYGMIDGLYQGVSALVCLAGGLAADRWQRHKGVAGLGYGLSAVCKLGLLIAGSTWSLIAAVVIADRIGKGIRTAPRDAMISLSSPPSGLAMAFGVHRALDTAGAMLGPLVAFAILAAMPGSFDVVFVVSFCVALIGLGAITLFLEPPRAIPSATPSRRSPTALLVLPRFRLILACGVALNCVTISDGFIYLTLQRKLDLDFGFFPLLYVLTALVCLLVAVPLGQVADRYGRAPIAVGGYALLVLVYGMVLLAGGSVAGLIATLVLLGISMAATDGVFTALASATLPAESQASGLSLLTMANGIGKFLASILFGVAWTYGSVDVAVLVFTAGLSLLTILAWVALNRNDRTHDVATASI